MPPARRDQSKVVCASKINPAATREAQRQWRRENRDSISTYNRQVVRHGVFSDGSRSF
ncbi:type II toxin-antitoxin system CcdA family antitoxin [Steroidobacter sp.]|uniref:type II toxin-antitoxin system CcdA family antitoxin n=1 Tax=Steroidobacter sp. TaxID=1978227 RepID=UPI001A4D3204|nr:type II toxin-antitoxin system CcdA family antitoxin [Steroidobacter sp.]